MDIHSIPGELLVDTNIIRYMLSQGPNQKKILYINKNRKFIITPSTCIELTEWFLGQLIRNKEMKTEVEKELRKVGARARTDDVIDCIVSAISCAARDAFNIHSAVRMSAIDIEQIRRKQ